MPTAISPSQINLYQISGAQGLSATSLTTVRLESERPEIALSEAPAREIPATEFTHGTVTRYTSAQLEMRPVDRADAALMSVIEPDGFRNLLDAIRQDGDWRAILEKFSQRIPSNPQWLNDDYRLPAAQLLERTRYLMDLSTI
ncbi:hypothetical protein [Pollutimonas bauzanensis]|uniref:Uncharacterized protein n=1 Tax=Pollutimonas bauzanensis TaxID=658167 RepID=A0A1M5ZWZ3_9BURK|nr:hypothetical protein [Pollutimonas bauzanensis]SHI28688.1 hypothetical protein SAMN04488135_1204 [Pollutimonas bauzanensis]